MRLVPEKLSLNDKPPQTEAEWAEALKLFGRDREDAYFQSSAVTPGPSGGPSQSYFPPTNAYRPADRRRSLIPRRGLEGSDDDDADDIDPTTSLRARKKENFGIAGLISTPPVCRKGDEDQWGAEEERKRVREFYDKEGWLPGPQPSYRTKSRRRRVIRRLGLAGDAEADSERRTIITNYMEMAKMVSALDPVRELIHQAFQAHDVSFAVFRDDNGYKYSIDPEVEPIFCSFRDTGMSQYLLDHNECVHIITDVQQDWRTRNNPFITKKNFKFAAIVPLLYPRHDPPVVFGALLIWDKEKRDVFTHREQEMLMKLSNMLVYQLATFQSEILAEKAAGMYESSLAFLRRSVVPKRLWQQHEPTPRKADDPDIKTRRERGKRRKRRAGENGITPGRSRGRPDSPNTGPDSPSGGASPELPPIVIKSGPKEQMDAHRRSARDDIDLHQDAASTLRGILDADALALINMEDYQMFYRRKGGAQLELDKPVTDPANVDPLVKFMGGHPWPDHLEPVIHHIPINAVSKNPVLGYAAKEDQDTFNFASPNLEGTLIEHLLAYLKTRRFWWNRDDGPDSLSSKLMAYCPERAETLLVHIMFTFDGRIRTALFATWNRPPSTFADSTALALPFTQIVGGLAYAALNFRKVRTMEQSQISYSNLQAHELRTPLHQILAITQLLRSAMLDLAETPQNCASYMNSIQQIRDLIPILDAIDTSGKTLHGIVDNILSFLDLKARDYSSPDSPRLFDALQGGPRKLVDMLEEVIVEAHEENERSRRSALQPLNCIETVFEIEPPELGSDFTEDQGGALRRALAKILSNAYKFIEGEGCVEIKVSDIDGYIPPKGCQGMCRTRMIQIEIIDNGPGMDTNFIRDHLGEPWAKQDAFTTGSGLSVHLAYRIIDIMGGRMEIHSAPGRGCIVRLQVPVERTAKSQMQQAAASKEQESITSDAAGIATQTIQDHKKVALIGFNIPDKRKAGLPRLGEALKRQYIKHGAHIVPLPDAELVIANGEVEEVQHGRLMMEHANADEIIFLVMPEHDPHPDVVAAAKKHGKVVKRLSKPITPSLIRHTLFPPASPQPRSTPQVDFVTVNSDDRRPSVATSTTGSDHRASFGSSSQPLKGAFVISPEAISTPSALPKVKIDGTATPPIQVRPSGGRHAKNSSLGGNWKPKGMCMEEAIANLSLGDYFSSARRASLKRTNSQTSSARGSSHDDEQSTPGTAYSDKFEDTPGTSVGIGAEHEANEAEKGNGEVEEEEMIEPDKIKVLVVEDNLINRKILVKILSKLPIDIIEAADGQEAVNAFTDMPGGSIILLDINMPRKDGFVACQEMRDMEKGDESRSKSTIIAVTALSAEEEKRHGQQVGFDQWEVKPCGKQRITKIVETARKVLLGVVDDEHIGAEVERRYTI